MSKAEIFSVVSVGGFILPCLASLLLYWLLPRPSKAWARLVIAVAAGWAFFFLYTLYVYNPAGISAGHEQGMHFPEGRFDNSTGAVALIAGWFYPAVSVLISVLAHRVWQRLRT